MNDLQILVFMMVIILSIGFSPEIQGWISEFKEKKERYEKEQLRKASARF